MGRTWRYSGLGTVAFFVFTSGALGDTGAVQSEIKPPTSKEEAKELLETLKKKSRLPGNFKKLRVPQKHVTRDRKFQGVNDTAKVSGKLVSAGAGDLLLSRPVDSAQAAKLARMGYRRVTSKKALSHQTLFESNAYLLYDIAAEVFVPESLSRLVGEAVELEIKRDKKGVPIVVAIRKAK